MKPALLLKIPPRGRCGSGNDNLWRFIVWQKAAFILIGLGVLVLIGWSVRVFFMDGDIPLLIRIAVGAIGAGMLVLIGVVIKDRLAKAKTEDFKGVEK